MPNTKQPIQIKLLFAGLILSVTACTSLPPMKGETKAGETLRADVVRQLTGRAKFSANCADTIESIQTQILRVNPIGTGNTAAAVQYGSVDERWVFSLCSQNIPFLVTFTPDGNGGTFFSTSPDQVIKPNWKPFRVVGEQIEYAVPAGWKLAWMEGKPDGSFFVEFIPKDETIEKWRGGYLLVQRLPYPNPDVLEKIKSIKSKIADVALFQFFEKANKACVGKNQLMSQRTNVFNSIYMAIGGGFCDRYAGAAPFGEGTVIAFAEGEDFLFQMQYGWRPANMQELNANLPWRINEEKIRPYLEAFKSSSLCGGSKQPFCKVNYLQVDGK